MRFVDFLKTTVLVCAAAATALGTLTVLAAADADDRTLVTFAFSWWTAATLLGGWLGRRAGALPGVARLLAGARSTTTLPDPDRPGRMLVSRLWPVLVVVVVSAALTWVIPQVPAIATGFLVILALLCRRQDAAVTAMEDRDCVAC